MDPICHTLVGWTLGQSGLKRWSPRGTATLVIAANIPDVDILAIAWGRNLELRRGWTHGLLALAVWPLLLAVAIWLWDRWRRAPADPHARYGPLAGLAAIGVLTHPFLDYLNNYGVRWLMPFQDRWFYGDTLFIVDPWILLILALGIGWSYRREHGAHREPGAPARIALASMMIYIGMMMTSTVLARRAVQSELAQAGLSGARFMVSAVPVDPFTKEVLVDEGRRYHLGRYRLLRDPPLQLDSTVEKGAQFATAVARARTSQPAKAYFHWSRFPVVVPIPGTGQLRAYDLRYVRRPERSWASLALTLPSVPPPPPAPRPSPPPTSPGSR